MDARNTIPSSSMRKGVSSNENANDITVHNDAILLTAASSETTKSPNAESFFAHNVVVEGSTRHT